MDEFGERLRAAAASETRRSPDARAPKALRGRIGRARLLRIGGSTAVAVVALGGVAAAGIGFTGVGAAPEPSPSAPVDLSIDGRDVAYATVPFPDDAWGYAWGQPGEFCGQPAPEMFTDEGFSGTVESPDALELDPAAAYSGVAEDLGARITISYSGDEDRSVFIDRPKAVFVRDGVVVGWDPWSEEGRLTTMHIGRSVSHTWEWGGQVAGCDTEDPYGQLEPGDYQMVIYSGVYMDEASAAMHSLAMDGYTLPPAADAPAFREGGYECAEAAMYFGLQPLTCSPNALPGVEFDNEAGTATVPYATSVYTGDLDLTYATAPIDVTLLPDENASGAAESVDMPYYEPGTMPACGDTYADGSYGTLEGVWDASMNNMRYIDEGDTLTPTLWRRATGWASAEVELPHAPRLWVAQWVEVEIEEEGGASGFYQGHRLMGWIDVEPTSGSTLTIDRYEGPSEWPLTVTDAQWCEGMGDPTRFDTVFLGEPAAITSDNGRRDELDSLLFQP